MKKLVLFLNDFRVSLEEQLLSETTEIKYILFEETGATESQKPVFGSANIRHLLSLLQSDISSKNLRSFIVLPSLDIFFAELKVPEKQFRQIQKALPYLVEDQIASDPEDCFIALGTRKLDYVKSAVIKRDVLSTWVEIFTSLDLYPERMVPDVTLLKHREHKHRLDIIDGYAFLHLVNDKYYAFQIELLPIYLKEIVKANQVDASAAAELKEKQDELDRIDYVEPAETILADVEIELDITLYIAEDVLAETESYRDKIDVFFRDFEQRQEGTITRNYALKESYDLYDEMANEICARTHHQNVINLLQGEFKPKRVIGAIKLDVNWKPFAAFLGVLVVLYLSGLFIEGIKYKQAAKQAELESQRIFKEIFPNTQSFAGMRQRVAMALQDSGTAERTPFLLLLYSFSNAIYEINRKQVDALKPTQIQFDEGSSDLKVDILADSFDTLNALKEQSEKLNLLMEISSTNTEKEGVKGRLRIRFSE